MSSPKYRVIDHRGIAGQNGGIQHNGQSVDVKLIAQSTVVNRVREMKRWARNGVYGTFRDITLHDGVRVVAATNYFRGVENMRVLRIESIKGE